MELNLLDRIIVLNTLLPETGTIEDIKLIMSIKDKIKLTDKEVDSVNVKYDNKNIMTVEAEEKILLSNINSYSFTLEEIQLMSRLAANLNRNGYVTVSSLSTIEKLINYTIEPVE